MLAHVGCLGMEQGLTCAGHLLANHQTDTQKRTVAVSADCPHLLLEIQEPASTDQPLLHLEILADFVQLVLHVFVTDREVADSGEGGRGFFPPVLTCKPTRGLVRDEHTNSKADRRETLHS